MLNEHLVERLAAWSREFSENVDEVHGWRSRKVRLGHLSEAHELRAILQAELGPDFEVVLDPIGSGSEPFGDEVDLNG
ncbi:hypothetical protein ASF40_05190 [Microbacterium sp. Leaf288]|uniref:hypothetical protein n=1 Tax=Microbacterium sp. Leaf288 TaxID=1736323 RepID=UPI0006F711DB|nr:hypothetical protein [Microbacterium sp. Leaf288]KQP71200.1 hypothetical protein ASF40_05190 [Microbacterium sp. Leaf288]